MLLTDKHVADPPVPPADNANEVCQGLKILAPSSTVDVASRMASKAQTRAATIEVIIVSLTKQ
jgi:hypothetical protein